MYFIHTIKADTHILPRINELNKLLHGTVELPDDVLHCQHHTKCHITVNHGCSCEYGNYNILHLINSDTPNLLDLL